jgi:hypothetical protein
VGGLCRCRQAHNAAPDGISHRRMVINGAGIGIIVRVVVALAGQVIAYFSDQTKKRLEEKR